MHLCVLNVAAYSYYPQGFDRRGNVEYCTLPRKPVMLIPTHVRDRGVRGGVHYVETRGQPATFPNFLVRSDIQLIQETLERGPA